jgi:hypothetical protein
MFSTNGACSDCFSSLYSVLLFSVFLYYNIVVRLLLVRLLKFEGLRDECMAELNVLLYECDL